MCELSDKEEAHDNVCIVPKVVVEFVEDRKSRKVSNLQLWDEGPSLRYVVINREWGSNSEY